MSGAEGAEEGGGPTGGGGGGGFGGGGLDFGSEEGGEAPEEAGGEAAPEEVGGEAAPEGGGESAAPEAAESPEPMAESRKRKTNVLVERDDKGKVKPKNKKPSNKLFNNLVGSISKEDDIVLNERVKVYDKSLKINEDINSVIEDIDRMLEE
jgi:hypothetical protein